MTSLLKISLSEVKKATQYYLRDSHELKKKFVGGHFFLQYLTKKRQKLPLITSFYSDQKWMNMIYDRINYCMQYILPTKLLFGQLL